VTANFAIPGEDTYVQQSTMTVQPGGTNAMYERQIADYLTTNPGRYYIVITARWADGTGISCPDSSEAVCDVESAW